MKTKQLILSILCLLMLWQMKGQIPSTYTLVATGNQTLTNQNMSTDANWYKWQNTNSTVAVKLKMLNNGNQKKLNKAEFYTESGGILTLQFSDTLRYDSSMYVQISRLSTSTNLYLKISTINSGCSPCYSPYTPLINLTFLNVTDMCSSYTQPSCEMIKDGDMEYYSGICPPLLVNSNLSGYRSCFWESLLTSNPSVYSTPDYYNSCVGPVIPLNYPTYDNANSTTNWQTSAYGSTSPYSGNAYSGIHCYGPGTESREYITNNLAQPMQAGKTYQVSFWVQLSPVSKWAVGDIAIFASTNKPTQNIVSGFAGTINTSSGTFVNSTGGYITNKTSWIQLTYNITPPTGSNYNWLTIGNIYNNLNTSKYDTDPSNSGSQIQQWSYYFIDKVSVKEIMNVTATASPTVVCPGGNTTLTASGASTYVWQPGNLTGSSVVVSPSTPTTYTVTGTNPSGCTFSTTVFVDMGPGYCCNTPSMTLTGNISNYGITNFGSGLFQVNGTLIINSTNVTFTNSQLRMAPNAKILVAPACTLNLASAHLFSCTNMWEGIELQNGSKLYATRNGVLGAYTTIDDARIAVYVNASGITAPNIILNYTTLSKNAVGVKIENYAGGASATYPISMGALTIQGNVATAYSPGTTLKPYLLSGTPVNYPTTIYGFQLNSVSRIQIGSTTGLYNYLQNLQIGVRGLKSNVLVHRCTFQNLTSSLDNKGIWMSGDYANSIIPPGGFYTFGTKYRLIAGSSGNANNFKNLKYGIYTDSCMSDYIIYNTFNDVSNTGIAVYRSNFFYGTKLGENLYNLSDRDTSYINNNTMSALPAGTNILQNGIGLYDNYYLYHLANYNTISLKPASGVWSTGEGMYHASTNYNSYYYTRYNTFNGNGNYGVYDINNNSARSINNNTITVGTGYCAGFFDTPNVGVFSLNSPYAVIKENIIDETSLGAAPSCMIGVYAYNGNQDYMGCNLMKNTNISTAVAFNNLNSTYRGNVMNGALVGLYLVGGSMGNVGASGDAGQNEWYSTSLSSYIASASGGENIYYDNSISARIPTANASAFPANPFAPILTSTISLGCTQYHKGGNNSDIQPKDDNNDKVTDVINGTIAFGKYQDGMLWEHRNGVLNLLKDSLLDNAKPLFKQFRNQQTNTNLGKINTLMRGLGDYAGIIQNKNAYLQQLNSIATTTNVIENNYKLFMNEYINNIVGVTTVNKSTYNNIQALAQKCPFTDGAVVFNARALMKIWGDDQVYSNVCETIVLPDTKLAGKFAQTMEPAQENVLVYPNPNNGTFSIAYAFEQSGQVFALYDLMGREIIRMSLENNTGIKEISNSDLNNGVYFYKITHGNNILFNGKLIINK